MTRGRQNSIISKRKLRNEIFMKLSIIICLYNTKKEYLEKCLSSIRMSTLNERDYEILLIDDGSTEDYSEIVSTYKPVYVKTENRGHFASRLYGIMIARGEYIAFCDSDDEVSLCYYAPMLKKIENSKSDIVLNDWAFYTEGGRSYCPNDIVIKNDFTYENEQVLDFYFSEAGRYQSVFVLWNKLIKRETALRAKEDIEKTDAIMSRISYSEDTLMTYFIYKHSKKITNVHTGYYFYRIHPQQSIAVIDDNRLKEQICHMGKTLSVIKEDLKDDQKHLAQLKGWSELMSRTHYSYAKAGKCTLLYPLIKEKYGVDKLQVSLAKDEPCHSSGHLGRNFKEIESVLYAISKIPSDVCVDYDKNDKYVSNMVRLLSDEKGKKIIHMKGAKIKVPKRKVSLKEKIFKGTLAHKVAKRLFKKGSKARMALKEKM